MTDDTATPRERDGSSGRATVLEVENLSHSFGDVGVFSDVSFSVAPGTVTALVGPNGSGKTTLLRAVLGLLTPDAGRVRLTPGDGVDDGDGAGREAGYLPQRPRFRPSFTVEETLGFYADLLAEEVDVSAAIERVGLSAAADRRVDGLSGGMTRLLGIGQAVLGDPSLVVLDEPTGDLDPRMTEYVFEVVRELADGGTTVLLATHNLAGAAAADAAVLLDRGGVVADGPPEEIVERTGAASFREAVLSLTGEDGDEREAPTPAVHAGGGDR